MNETKILIFFFVQQKPFSCFFCVVFDTERVLLRNDRKLEAGRNRVKEKKSLSLKLNSSPHTPKTKQNEKRKVKRKPATFLILVCKWEYCSREEKGLQRALGFLTNPKQMKLFSLYRPFLNWIPVCTYLFAYHFVIRFFIFWLLCIILNSSLCWLFFCKITNLLFRAFFKCI